MRKPITRALAEGLDDQCQAAGLSRAAVGRRAGIDASTLWRSVHRGEGRPSTMADYAEAVAAMIEPEAKGSVAAILIREVCAWIGDRRGGQVPEAAIAQLNDMICKGDAFEERFGQPGLAFVSLATTRAFSSEDNPAERTALAALGLLMLERAC